MLTLYPFVFVYSACLAARENVGNVSGEGKHLVVYANTSEGEERSSLAGAGLLHEFICGAKNLIRDNSALW